MTMHAVGTRVFANYPIDRYPHFVVPEGATGTVGRADDRLWIVTLDAPVPGCEPWDNEVYYEEGDGTNMADDWKVVA